MLKLLNKEIDLIKSKILFKTIVTPDNFDDHFITYNSKWTVEEGWITGRNPNETAGMAILNTIFREIFYSTLKPAPSFLQPMTSILCGTGSGATN